MSQAPFFALRRNTPVLSRSRALYDTRSVCASVAERTAAVQAFACPDFFSELDSYESGSFFLRPFPMTDKTDMTDNNPI